MSDHYSDGHNVGLGMVQHRAKCTCLECDNERLRAKVRELESENAKLRERLERMYREGYTDGMAGKIPYEEIHQRVQAINEALNREESDE